MTRRYLEILYFCGGNSTRPRYRAVAAPCSTLAKGRTGYNAVGDPRSRERRCGCPWSVIKSTTPWRIMAEPPTRKPEITNPLCRARQSENVTAKSMGWRITRSASRDEVGGAHRPAKPRRRRAGAALLSDRRVTPSQPLPLRRNAGVTVQQLGSHAGVTAQPNAAVKASH
jgi:hypothetical protein